MDGDTKHILFDIDRTLFDTDKFLEYMNQALMLKLGARTEEFSEVLQEYYESGGSGNNFVADDYLKHLSDSFSMAKEPLEEIFWDRGRYSKFAYPDVVETLDLLSRKFEVGIFSEGDEEYQAFKMKSLAITLFINEDLIYITKDKTDEDFLRKIDDNTIIVDDSLRIIDYLNQFENFKPIWMNRDDSKKHDEVPTIKELDEVPPVVEKEN